MKMNADSCLQSKSYFENLSRAHKHTSKSMLNVSQCMLTVWRSHCAFIVINIGDKFCGEQTIPLIFPSVIFQQNFLENQILTLY